MKVCTDSCLFGAWMAKEVATFLTVDKNMLDIGSGTGLLTLMMAQKTASEIDAIEIDESAVGQASENINQSIWKNKIQVIHQSIQLFAPQKKYDFIFSNPPFFEGDLRSIHEKQNDAKHDTTLTIDDLIGFIKKYLKNNGRAAILLPYHRAAYFEELLKKQLLYIQRKVVVKQTVRHGYFRVMYIFSSQLKLNEQIEDALSIKDENGVYTQEFISLLKDYYLNL